MQNFDQLRVGQHMYNQWLADVCSIEPERHIGLMHLPMWDIDAAIEELTWARSVGLKGVNFPTPKQFLLPYNSPDWDPFFAACEDLDVTLCNHGGAGASGGSYPGAMSIAKYEISMMARICPMDLLVFGGVFERHPGLKLVLTESPGTWWNFVLQEMDSIYITDTRSYGPSEKERVPRLPSEYAREQVFIGASFHARFEAEDALLHGYADRVIWGSDYPHFEGTYQYGADGPNGEPMTWAALRFHYAGLPIDAVESFLGKNAMNAYDLDYNALDQGRGPHQRADLRRPQQHDASRNGRRAPATSRSAPSGSGPSPDRAESAPVSDELKVERRGSVLVVTIDRQERMNSLSQEVHDGLRAAWTRSEGRSLRARDRHHRRR